MNDADKCRSNGWIPGTLLVGDEGYGPTVIRITAIGKERMLAYRVTQNGESVEFLELPWTLCDRDWKKVAAHEENGVTSTTAEGCRGCPDCKGIIWKGPGD